MATTLADITALAKDRLRDQSGQSIDFTANGFRAINSTLRIWNEVHDWPFTIKQVNFNFNPGIDTYSIDGLISDFKYPLTIKGYKPFMKYAEYWMTSPLRFDSAYIYPRRFAVQNVSGIQTLRLASLDGSRASINTATAYNQNGQWVGASGIGTVATDLYEGYSMPSSVSFLFNGTSGTLTNDATSYPTFTPVDLSIYQNRSNLYFDIYIPATTNLTSFTLKWGSDSSNYYSASATTDYVGAVFIVGWNRIKMSFVSPTTVGTPVVGAIDYLQLTVTCSGSTNLGLFRVQNFWVSENVPIQMTYYSNNLVSTSAGVQSQVFASAAATTDYPLWSGRWDIATEAFIDSLLQILFWMTGESDDMKIAISKITDIIKPLKERYPSQRRYPSVVITTDTNFGGRSNQGANQFTDGSDF